MATYGTSNKYINYSVNSQEISTNKASNTSVVRVWIDVWRTNSGYTTYGTGTAYARINGTVYSAGISTSQKITSTAIRLLTQDVTVAHDANGSKTISITGWISHQRFSSSEQGYSHTLTTIPRQANITGAWDMSDTDNPKITFSNPGGFSLSVWIEPNPNGTHYAVRNNIPNTGTYQWTLTDGERSQLRNACKGKTCTVRFGLYSNGTQWASYVDKKFTMTEASVRPTGVSVVAATVNDFSGLCLKGRSSVKFTVSASAQYGATISSYYVTGNEFSYSGTSSSCTTDVMNAAGTFKYTATVTDSRGFSSSSTVSVTVTDYAPPILSISPYRSDADGTKNIIKGTSITTVPSISISTLGGKNAISSGSISIAGTVKSSSISNGGRYIYSGYGIGSSYAVTATVKDKVGNTSSVTVTVPMANMPFNIPKAKDAVGLGTIAKYHGYINIGYGFIDASNGTKLYMVGKMNTYDG